MQDRATPSSTDPKCDSGGGPRRRLRVAIVAPSLDIVGGQAVQAGRLLDRWAGDADVHAWLVPINPRPRPPFDRLLRHKYIRTFATQLWYWPSLVRELRKADVTHVFSAAYSSFLLAPLPAILVAKALRKPVIVNYRSGEGPDHLRRSRFARWILRHVDLNVVPSRFLRGEFAPYGVDARVVANTIDLRQFSYRVRDPLRPRLLSTRNFEPLYNVACTLRAFARVQARFPDAELTLVGDGSCAKALRSLARDLGVRNVTFAGRVAPADMATYYAASDIYVQTPSIDNMPGSVIEAFASGLPVVATEAGGVPTILTHGVHGLLAPTHDHDAIAGHVITLLERPDYARQLAAAAFESCRQYEWEVLRDRWLAVYGSVAPLRAPVRTTPRAKPSEPQVAIAIVISSFEPGGTERQMSELICRLNHSRFKVHPVCFRREGMWLPKVEAAAGVSAEFMLQSFRKPAVAALAIRFARWCREHQIALVQTCDIYANIFALPAAAFARVPVRIGSRRGILNPAGTRGLLVLQRAAYAFAHCIVANSEAAAACLRHEGVPSWKIRTIANGIDLDMFDAAPRQRPRRVITTVANLRAGKGHDVLLRAARRVLARVPDARFELIGDGILRSALEQAAVDLGISGSVAFRGHCADVPARLAASDLFAFPSFMEASPNSVIEAMAARLPVVATNVGGIGEIIEDGRNGLLVPAGNDEALANALLRLIDRPDEAAAFAETARQTVEMRYSFDRMVDEFEKLYIEELSSRQAGTVEPLTSGNAA
jgi:glycosyltransferase involved in cell wall biosynthesis